MNPEKGTLIKITKLFFEFARLCWILFLSFVNKKLRFLKKQRNVPGFTSNNALFFCIRLEFFCCINTSFIRVKDDIFRRLIFCFNFSIVNSSVCNSLMTQLIISGLKASAIICLNIHLFYL